LQESACLRVRPSPTPRT